MYSKTEEVYPRDTRRTWQDRIELNNGGFIPGKWLTHSSPGISIRDWLAGLAMQGLVSKGIKSANCLIAKTAYEIADAMIEEGLIQEDKK